MKKISARVRMILMLRRLSRGKFHRVIRDRDTLEQWRKYVMRQSLTPHCKHIILRLTLFEGDKPWNLWAVYHVVEMKDSPIGAGMVLESVMIPADEESRMTVPDRIADEPYFGA